ncbi:hypothetical protein [Leucobacter salsicius]|uniref:hypothetical protein n=1 Tax=Leucobacter salsicius TaxID=664638 RepID=UPI0003651661|nr:hypothetical protein [Leucobacter salsicius]
MLNCKTITRVTGALGVAALALSLAACSGGQSVAEACQIAQDSIAQASDQVDQLMSEAVSGGGTMKDLVDPLNDALDGAEKKVTNPEVSAALKSMNSEFVRLGDLLEGVPLPDTQDIDPDAAATPEELKTEEALEAISGELEKRNAALEQADMQLQELCGAS